MYEYCQANNIPHRKPGKLLVAQEHQIPYIENLYKKTRELSWPQHSDPSKAGQPVVPARLIDADEAHVSFFARPLSGNLPSIRKFSRPSHNSSSPYISRPLSHGRSCEGKGRRLSCLCASGVGIARRRVLPRTIVRSCELEREQGLQALSAEAPDG